MSKKFDSVGELLNSPDTIIEGKEKVIDAVKTNMFDFIGAIIIASALLLALGALKLRDLTWDSLLDMIIGFMPYYFASVLLSNNYYLKGSYKAKTTAKYCNAIKAYSKSAASLDGDQLAKLSVFCEEYNETALKKIQTAYLKAAALTYEQFNEEWYDNKNVLMKPLKIWEDAEIKKYFTKEQRRRIIAAKRAHVKGINENLLLSNVKSNDDTNIGKNEEELAKTDMLTSYALNFISMAILWFIGFKDVLEWGWVALFLVAFKMAWIFSKSYMRYYKGYNNIVNNLVSHLLRKDDILKQFNQWYKANYAESEHQNVLTFKPKQVINL